MCVFRPMRHEPFAAGARKLFLTTTVTVTATFTITLSVVNLLVTLLIGYLAKVSLSLFLFIFLQAVERFSTFPASDIFSRNPRIVKSAGADLSIV